MKREGHRRSRWPGFFIFLAIVALIGLLVWLLPVFRLNAIEVPELRSLDSQPVIDASGLVIGRHLFRGLGGNLDQMAHLRYPQVEAKLLAAFPTIKSVRASLKFPGKISLAIEERVEVAYVSFPDGCVMIDKEGVALKIWQDEPQDIPIIEGVSATSLVLGKPLEVDVPSAMNSAITLMGAIIEADKDSRAAIRLLPQIRTIRPLTGSRLYLTVILPRTGEELTVLSETGQDQTEDMLWLRFALAQGSFDGRGKGVLDLTGSRKTFTPD